MLDSVVLVVLANLRTPGLEPPLSMDAEPEFYVIVPAKRASCRFDAEGRRSGGVRTARHLAPRAHERKS